MCISNYIVVRLFTLPSGTPLSNVRILIACTYRRRRPIAKRHVDAEFDKKKMYKRRGRASQPNPHNHTKTPRPSPPRVASRTRAGPLVATADETRERFQSLDFGIDTSRLHRRLNRHHLGGAHGTAPEPRRGLTVSGLESVLGAGPSICSHINSRVLH